MDSVATFFVYVGFLSVSGLILLALAITGWGTRGGTRVLNGLFGAGFLGYAVYLLFFSTSDTYYMFLYAFVVPILLIFQAVKNARIRKTEELDSRV